LSSSCFLCSCALDDNNELNLVISTIFFFFGYKRWQQANSSSSSCSSCSYA
jgi:hypothetical protein